MSGSTLIPIEAADLMSALRKNIALTADNESPVSFCDTQVNESQGGSETGPRQPHGFPASSALDNLRLLLGSVETEAAAFGALPPSPPTVRGQIGLPVVRLINRLTWWQTTVWQRFANIVCGFLRIQLDEQAQQQRKLASIANRQSVFERRVDELERKHQSHSKQAQRRDDVEVEKRFQQLVLERDELKRNILETTHLVSSTQHQCRHLCHEIQVQRDRLTSSEQQTQFGGIRIAGVESAVQLSLQRLQAMETAVQDLSRELQKAWAGLAAEMGARETTDRRVKTVEGKIQDTLEEISRGARVDERLYLELQSRFRGSREEIQKRQRIYIPILAEAGVGAEDRPVVDLGCGRGEWLEILKSEGLSGFGVDSNPGMLAICRSMGLRVYEAEAQQYLSDLPEASAGAITSFHLIEHLQFRDLVALLDSALRVLQPGGLLILETPNPYSVLVSTHSFYLDPTHVKPIPSELLWFAMEARGFRSLRLLQLHPPVTNGALDDETEIGRRFQASLDYAIIGERP